MLSAVLMLALGPTMAEETPLRRPMAYVVCGGDYYDQHSKVYRVDLQAGALLGVSDSIDWLGNAEKLSFDPVRSRLYIASMRGRSYRYWPVTAVHVKGGTFEVVRRFSTAPDDALPRGAGETRTMKSGETDSRPPNTNMNEAYEIVVSRDGKELYVSYGGLSDTGNLSAVWDSETGEVLRFLPNSIRRSHHWSPDGKQVAAIWPGGERTRRENGQQLTQRWPGGVSVIDVQTGDRATTYLEENQGLHPPWRKIEGPFIRVHGSGRLQAFDRNTGRIISEFNVQEIAGLTTHYGGVSWSQPPVLDDGKTIVLNMRCYERAAEKDGSNCLWPTPNEGPNIIEHTYVVLIDAIQQTEVTRTEVGVDCSNPALAYE